MFLTLVENGHWKDKEGLSYANIHTEPVWLLKLNQDQITTYTGI